MSSLGACSPAWALEGFCGVPRKLIAFTEETVVLVPIILTDGLPPGSLGLISEMV